MPRLNVREQFVWLEVPKPQRQFGADVQRQFVREIEERC
jgi:hypothetical protein